MALLKSCLKIATKLQSTSSYGCNINQLILKRNLAVGSCCNRDKSEVKDEIRPEFWWREWDGSIDHGDDTDIAFQTLDIAKLKPHPEYRNVAAGLVLDLHQDPFEVLWSKYENYNDELIEKDNEAWEQYIKEHGHSPADYFSTTDYQFEYSTNKIWQSYKRNFKGGKQPQVTRTTCETPKGYKASACPLCRNPKVQILYQNKPLLMQFIDPLSNEVYPALRTGACRRKQAKLIHTIKLAQNCGILEVPMPDVMEQDLNQYRIDHPALAKWR